MMPLFFIVAKNSTHASIHTQSHAMYNKHFSGQEKLACSGENLDWEILKA